MTDHEQTNLPSGYILLDNKPLVGFYWRVDNSRSNPGVVQDTYFKKEMSANGYL